MMQQAMAQDQLGQQQTMVPTQQQFQTQQLVQQHMLQPQIVQTQQHIMQQQQQQMQQQQLLQGQQQIVQGQAQQILQGQQNAGQQQLLQGQQQLLHGQQHLVQGQQIVQQMLQPQLGQQMLYCPTVRLVYDTSMLMQPGDQIQQQNQNIFVNQPPWARSVQNQVIYVQQIGPNLVPVQHIDPNLYLQQNMPMYQQVVQNMPQLVQNLPQTVQNVQQVRPLINNIPGLVQNFNANIQNVPEQNVAQIQNIGFVQSNQDVNNIRNANNANNEAERQATNQVNQQNAQNQEMNQMYRQVVSQVSQPQPRPMIQMTSQIQNVQIAQQQQQINTQNTNANVRHTNTGNVQVQTNTQNVRPQILPNTISNQNPNQNLRMANSNTQTGTNLVPNNVSNVHQVRHIMPNQVNFAPRSVQQNIVNTSVQGGNLMNTVGNLNTVTYSAVRNGQPYTYRAIQPKQNTNVRINYTPRAQPPMVRKTVPNLLPNNANNMSNANHNVPVSTGFVKMETDSPVFNKKRKSESPDEVQKKISNYGSVTVTSQVKDKIKAKYGVHTNEIGINTSPVHKPKTENHPLLQINPMEAKIKQEVIKPPEIVHLPPTVPNMQANVPVKKEAIIEPSVKKDVSQQTEEKLVRKTVFPQATTRGRLLDDKVNINAPKIEDIKPNIQPNVIENKDVKMAEETNKKVEEKPMKLEELKSLPILPVKNEIVPTLPTETKVEPKKENLCVINKVNDTLANIKYNNTPQDVTMEIKKDNIKLQKSEDGVKKEKSILEKALNPSPDPEVKPESPKATKINTDFEQVIEGNKIEKTEYKNINDISGTEIHIVAGSVHKEEKSKDYILTHVLDGYVIQESNVPFAIRKPLKEKPVNTVLEEKHDPGMKNLTKEEMKDKILELSQLHIEDSSRERKEEIKSEKEEQKVVETSVEEVENIEVKDPVANPFIDLKQSVVKTWTIEDLAKHLTKHGWSETVALLQEHEIDGESLFLVTRTQLVTIGVNENHAELICEFVGSKS